MSEIDLAALRERLTQDAGPVHGSDLRAHLARDAVLVVGPSVPLIECAMAVATDDAAAVGRWLAEGAVRRPDASERAAWPDDEARRWVAVVLRPFVLVQDPSS